MCIRDRPTIARKEITRRSLLLGGGVGSAISTKLLGAGGGYQRGTYNVPRDELAMVHRGERITPAGDSTKAGAASISIGNVTIQVQNLTDIKDVETFAAMLSIVRQTKMTTRSGGSRYRLR